MLIFLQIFTFFFILNALQSQVIITDPNINNPVDLNRCSGEGSLEAELLFEESGQAIIQIDLPQGVTYVDQSINIISSNAPLAIVQISGGALPSFEISPVVSIGNELRISFDVEADCEANLGSNNAQLNVSLDGGTPVTGFIQADLLEADLSLVSHPQQVGEIGEMVQPNINIFNGGLGHLESFTFFIVEDPTIITQEILANGQLLPVSYTQGDTTFYELDATYFNDETFDNSEIITISRKVLLDACPINDTLITNSYGSFYGCPGICQEPVPVVSGQFKIIKNPLKVNINAQALTQIKPCGQTEIELTYTNVSSQSPGINTAFNLEIFLGLSNAIAGDQVFWMFSQMSTATIPTEINLGYNYYVSCDTSCKLGERISFLCQGFSLSLADGEGESTCLIGGLTPSFTLAQRLNLGYTDYTHTEKANPDLLSPFNLKRVRPCDSVEFTLEATQTAGFGVEAMHPNAYLEVVYANINNSPILKYLGGTFEFYDASADTLIQNILLPLPLIEEDTGFTHFIVFDFSPYLPDGVIEYGDKISVKLRSFVLDNQYKQDPGLVPNLEARFFNLPPSVNDPLSYSDRVTCFSRRIELYVDKPDPKPVAVGQRLITGCDPFDVAMGFRVRSSGIAKDHYPGENRGTVIMDSLVITILNDDQFDPNSAPLLKVTDDGGTSIDFILPPPVIDGNRYTFINDGSLPVGDDISAGGSLAALTYTPVIKLLSSCQSSQTDEDSKVEFFYTFNNHTQGVPDGCPECATKRNAESIRNDKFSLPAFNLVNQTGVKVSDARTECFDLTLINTTSQSSGNFLWLAFEEAFSPMKAVYLINADADTLIPLLPYEDGQWAKIANELGPTEKINLQACVQTASCPQDSLKVVQGWDCAGYPDNPKAFPCDLNEVLLEVIPLSSSIQGDFVFQTSEAVPLCGEGKWSIRMNASQVGDVLDPFLQIPIVEGIQLADTALVEYPLGSGNIEKALLDTMGGFYLLDISQHSLIFDSLPGLNKTYKAAMYN